jgi:uncharacterized protein with HEPN domain
MTVTVAFDKLAFVRRLEAEGHFSRSQAETLSEALHQAVSETVATKADLAEIRHEMAGMRAELTHEMATMRTELTHEMGAMRTELTHEIAGMHVELTHEIAGMRTELTHETTAVRADFAHSIDMLRYELKLWMGSLAAGLFAALSGVAAAMRFLGHS